jgi:hypothetical protein
MIPPETREILEDLRDDLETLHFKWALHKELFQSGAHAALLSQAARAFFQTVEESIRNDIVMAICRLGDPARTLGGDAVSFGALAARCDKIPNLEHRLTAFQAACGPVRRYRNRRFGHNDRGAFIKPRAELLPGIECTQVDEILRLADQVLSAVYQEFTGGHRAIGLNESNAARALIRRLEVILARDQRYSDGGNLSEGGATPSGGTIA